jgi:hypothetical protein
VLFGQDGSDEADQGVAAEEDPDDVGPPAYFRLRRSWGLLGQIWRQSSLRMANV